MYSSSVFCGKYIYRIWSPTAQFEFFVTSRALIVTHAFYSGALTKVEYMLQAIHKALTKGDLGDERSDSELSDEDEVDEKKTTWAHYETRALRAPLCAFPEQYI